VTYILWVPAGVTRLRGVIVHQHGAGRNAAEHGATAAYDLHWQALAKKWDCALLARSITYSMTRSTRRRVARNCGSIPAWAPTRRFSGRSTSWGPSLATPS